VKEEDVMPIYSPDKNDTQRTLGFLMTSVAAGALLFVAACSDQEQARTDDDGDTKVSEAPKTEPTSEVDVVLNGEISSKDQGAIDFMSADEFAVTAYRTREAMPLARATGAPQAYPQPVPGDVNRERYENFDENPIKLVSEDPVSTFSVDVDTAS
jgi:hypothetical protein